MQKFKLFFTQSVLFCTIILTAVAFICSILVIETETKALRDGFTIGGFSPLTMLATACGVFCLVIFFTWIFKRIENLSRKQLNILTFVLFGVYLIFSIVVLSNFVSLPTTDSRTVARAAFDIASGNLNQVDTASGYFSMYSNNNAYLVVLIYFFKLLFKLGVTNYYLALNLLSFLCLFVFEIFGFLAVRKLKGEIFSLKYLLTSVLHPIMYLTIPWVYTIPISMTFMGLVFYLGVRIYKSKTLKDTIISTLLFGFCVVVGFLLRAVVIFLAVAFLVCLLLWISKDKKKIVKTVLSLALCLIVAASTYLVSGQIIKQYSPSKEGNLPVTHWVMMGLNQYGTFNHEDAKFTYSFETKEEKVNANLGEIKNRLGKLGPIGFFKHLVQKQVYTWSFGSAAYSTRLKLVKEHTPIYNYVTAQQADFLHLFTQIFRATILFLTLIYLIQCFRKKRINSSFLLIVFLFGAYIFYLIWEGKNSYSIPFLFALIFLASEGVGEIGKSFAKKKTLTCIKKGIIPTFVLVCVLMLSLINPFCVKQRDIINYGILTGRADYDSSIKLSDSKTSLNQKFAMDDDFNTIYIKCRKTEGNAKYNLTFKNDQNEVIHSKIISSKNIKNDKILIRFDEQKPKGKQQYELQISPVNSSLNENARDSINWGISNSKLGVYYDGELTQNNESKNFLLAINAYNLIKKPIFSLPIYLLICVTLLLFIWLNFSKFKATFKIKNNE